MTTPAAPTPEAAPSLVSTPPAPVFTPLTADLLSMPEGFDLDPESSTALLDILNNQELTAADRANALIALQASLTTKSSEAGSQKWQATQADWQNQVTADPEIGGANLAKTIANIGNLMTRFGNDDVRKAMDETGAGNHPAVVKFLNTVAQQLGESVIVPPGGPASTQSASLADRIFAPAKPN